MIRICVFLMHFIYLLIIPFLLVTPFLLANLAVRSKIITAIFIKVFLLLF